MESGGLGDRTAFAPGPVAEAPGAPVGTATSPSKKQDTTPIPGYSSARLGTQRHALNAGPGMAGGSAWVAG